MLNTVKKHFQLTQYHSLDEMENFLITDKGNIVLLLVSVQVQSKSISDVYRGILVWKCNALCKNTLLKS